MNATAQRRMATRRPTPAVDLDEPLIKEEISRHGSDVWLTLAPAPVPDEKARFGDVVRR